MKCVIIANGDLEYTQRIKKIITSARLIVCCDGGARHLRALSIIPTVIIGDFDSILPDDKLFFSQKEIETVAFPSRKDQTDTDLCVSWALKHHAADITFLGVTGSRLDHTLANIFLLKKLAEKKIPARIIDKNNEIHVVTGSIELSGQPGSLVSIIPATEVVSGLTIKGLEYPLVNADIKMGSSLGISNYFKKTTAVITIEKGILIVTKSKD